MNSLSDNPAPMSFRLRLVDPVCGKTVTVEVSGPEEKAGVKAAFCSTACLIEYDRQIQARLREVASARSDCDDR